MTEDERIEAGVRALILRFECTQAGNMTEHLRIADDPTFHRQVVWLKRHRRDLWDLLRPVILESWHRVYPEQFAQRAAAKAHAEGMRAHMLRHQRKVVGR